MAEDKRGVKTISTKIQGGFFPPDTPVIRGSIMTGDKKGNINEGFVPAKQPAKPAGKEDKGFVPPQPPRKPPDKPDQGKK